MRKNSIFFKIHLPSIKDIGRLNDNRKISEKQISNKRLNSKKRYYRLC